MNAVQYVFDRRMFTCLLYCARQCLLVKLSLGTFFNRTQKTLILLTKKNSL